MKSVNVAELRSHFGKYLAAVERGEEINVCKRNKRVARIQRSSDRTGRNETRLGCAKGTVRIIGDIVAPAFRGQDWEMME